MEKNTPYVSILFLRIWYSESMATARWRQRSASATARRARRPRRPGLAVAMEEVIEAREDERNPVGVRARGHILRAEEDDAWEAAAGHQGQGRRPGAP